MILNGTRVPDITASVMRRKTTKRNSGATKNYGCASNINVSCWQDWLRGLDLNQRPLGYEFLNHEFEKS